MNVSIRTEAVEYVIDMVVVAIGLGAIIEIGGWLGTTVGILCLMLGLIGILGNHVVALQPREGDE